MTHAILKSYLFIHQWACSCFYILVIMNMGVAVVQLSNQVHLFATLWIAHQASLSLTISWSLLKFTSIELVMPSNHLILCCPLLLLSSVFSSIRVFSNESTLCKRWPKYWSFSLLAVGDKQRNITHSFCPYSAHSPLRRTATHRAFHEIWRGYL